MALTPEQIQAIAGAHGDTVVSNVSSNVSAATNTSVADAFAKRMNLTPSSDTSTFSSVAGDIGESFSKRADEVGKIVTDPKLSAGGKTLDVLGKGADVVQDVVGDVVKSAIKPEVLQGIGDMLGHAADSPAVTALAHSPAVQSITKWFQGLSPETQGHLKATGSIVSLLSNAVGAGAAKEGVVAGTEAALSATEKAVAPAVKAIDTTKAAILPTKQTVRARAATGGVPGIEGMGTQAQTSAERLVPSLPLQGAGAAIRPTPLQAYDQFATQEAKHLGDIKHDPAISMVGERLGNAFSDSKYVGPNGEKSVIEQRKIAGKTMSDELAKTATKPVNTKGAFGNFQSELIDNGAHYDAINGELVTGKTSKFASDDKRILTKYASELQSLGSNPTMKQVDAFISRMPKEIDGLKAERGITFNTNAERLIKTNLNDLRTALGKAGTKEYSAARKSYADLSKFIDEGASHLGKMTQSGDFAKDASVAKSAVQSVLNNGKKDWLIELEKKTGYPALDEATLALQAMKDAGDAKGSSLLQLMTDGASVPTTPHGLAGMIVGFGGKMASKAVLGSKAEQTRAFLKSLDKK